MTWNQQQEEAGAEEKIDRCVKFSDHVALVVSERKRAFEAWQKAQQLQTELDASKAAHAWIKTSERMPPRGSVVLVVFDNGNICTGQCYLSARGSLELTEHAVAWMPLPEPPK